MQIIYLYYFVFKSKTDSSQNPLSTQVQKFDGWDFLNESKKHTRYKSDSKTIDYIIEYDPQTDNQIKLTYYKTNKTNGDVDRVVERHYGVIED
ncbi:hypothetical protein HPP_4330 [Hydrangea phyllody phytoplasma]|uniref:DUF2963 domain-containing protein n=2 Tax=16SrI (Aster yellows group) TaxID=3042590 RepID=A0ABQ5PT62_9MOLU|nr:DUF2963 domain-containing protein [Hydrangea phyllody phytoplasma]GFZ75475.1 hypothetical protein HPP_4330 [Hydrangea phyllody phytoplasma]GLH61559.1 hypothetical protein RHYP_5050 [Rhus yellows phytoplasma]GLH62145.1 hypothetical protein HP2P_5520 [Hydrangea phyllody phytoplasma]